MYPCGNYVYGVGCGMEMVVECTRVIIMCGVQMVVECTHVIIMCMEWGMETEDLRTYA